MSHLAYTVAPHWHDGAIILDVWIKPQSKTTAWGAFLETDVAQIKIAAPPVDGKANAALRGFLAQEFGVSISAVELLRGQTSRHKRLKINRPTRIPTCLTPWLSSVNPPSN